MSYDKRFSTSIRGFDKDDVIAYIEKMSKEFEEKMKEKDEELSLLKIQNKDFKGKYEKLLEQKENTVEAKNKIADVLIRAQDRADTMVDEAKEKASTMLDEAQESADSIINEAQLKASEILSDVNNKLELLELELEDKKVELNISLENEQKRLDESIEALKEKEEVAKNEHEKILSFYANKIEEANEIFNDKLLEINKKYEAEKDFIRMLITEEQQKLITYKNDLIMYKSNAMEFFDKFQGELDVLVNNIDIREFIFEDEGDQIVVNFEESKEDIESEYLDSQDVEVVEQDDDICEDNTEVVLK